MIKNILKKATKAGIIMAAGLMFTCTGQAADETAKPGIAVNESNFPDSSFRAYISANVDKDKDNILTDTEISAVTDMNIRTRGISDLKGIEYFTGLKELNASGNKIKELDLTADTELTYLNVSNNDLTVLKLDKAVLLRNLLCSGNNLSNLDISANTELDTVDVSGNRLAAFDISKNVRLTSLNASDNAIIQINTDANTLLKKLDVNYNEITAVNLKNNTALTELNIRSNRLVALDLQSNTGLKYVECSYNGLISLAPPESVETLLCSNNQLYVIELQGLTHLKELNVSNNELYSVDLSACTELVSLDVSGNHLAAINIEANTQLSKDVSAGGNVREVYVGEDKNLYLTGLGIDTAKVKGLTGATLSSAEQASIAVADTAALPEKITYTYDMGNNLEQEFTLIPVLKKKLLPSKTDISIYIYEEMKDSEYQLSAVSIFESPAVKWESSNITVAKVSEDGKVTPVAPGTAVITASAEGYESAEFTVNVYNQVENIEIDDIPDQYYTGAAVTPAPIVKDGDCTLVKDTDYTVSYENNTAVGNAIITVKGCGKYSFTISKNFKICYNIGLLNADAIPDQTYTGTEIKPDVVIKNGTYTLKNGVDYTLSYMNNTTIGTGIVTVNGKGDYLGTKIQAFNIIVPQVTNLVKVGNKKMQITLTWTAIPGVDGYRIYKYNELTGKYNYLKQLDGSAQNSYVDTGLTAGTRYRYRVRAFVKVNNENKYGKYSTKYKTATRLKKVTPLKVKAGTRKASLSWKKTDNAEGYEIRMKTGNGEFSTIKTITKGKTVSYTKTGLSKGKVYYFRVRAYRTVSGTKIYGSCSKIKSIVAK